MGVTNYMISCDSEPLAFWQQHSGRFSMLSKLSELYLSSASVPVEAIFSATGVIVNGKRLVMASSVECHSFMYAYLLNSE